MKSYRGMTSRFATSISNSFKELKRKLSEQSDAIEAGRTSIKDEGADRWEAHALMNALHDDISEAEEDFLKLCRDYNIEIN